MPKQTIRHIIASAEADMLREEQNEMLKKQGSVAFLSHSESEPGKRLQNELYCKQTHDGCIIAGSDCKVVS